MRITHFLDNQRKKQKITQEGMAKHLGISVQAYRRRLTGNAGFSEAEIEVAARVLDVQVQAIMKDQIV